MAFGDSRKVVDAFSALRTAAKVKNRAIMNDMIYYLRKLLTLAKSSQKLSLYESADVVDELKEIEKEIERLEEEVRNLEKE